MERFRRKISILGKGEFGNYLYNFTKKNYTDNVQCISLRGKNHIEILEKIKSSKVIIDCMDRNIIDLDTERLNFIEKIRNEICIKNDIFYVYLSSSNVYKDSIDEINEDGELAEFDQFNYEQNKILVERYLIEKLNIQNLLILRMPTLWHLEMNNGSFMGDLLSSFKNKEELKPRLGDERIISYIHIKNAAEILFNLYLNNYYGINNVSTEEWSSRQNLKLKIKNKKNLIGKKIITKNYDYQSFINKKFTLL